MGSKEVKTFLILIILAALAGFFLGVLGPRFFLD